jgi:cytochrome c
MISKPGLTVAFIALAVALQQPACAHPDAGELVDQQHCMFCHTSDAPHLALPFAQIAADYRNVPDARSELAQKVALKGAAHWGNITMPVSDRVDPLSPDDAQTIALWLLAQ